MTVYEIFTYLLKRFYVCIYCPIIKAVKLTPQKKVKKGLVNFLHVLTSPKIYLDK